MSRAFSPQIRIAATASGTQPLLTIRKLRSLARKTINVACCSRPIDLSVAFVDRRQSRMYNRRYRKRNAPTNVLSFSLSSRDPESASNREANGEIILCVPVIRAEASKLGLPVKRHAERLFVHGMLHILGYDHATEGDFRRMQRAEIGVLGDWVQ